MGVHYMNLKFICNNYVYYPALNEVIIIVASEYLLVVPIGKAVTFSGVDAHTAHESV